jgi:predicted nucleotidyltransferase
MASLSKEENILKLILENSPLKEWHLKEIVKEAKVTKRVANKWLKSYVSNRLLKHIKKKGEFPYFIVGANNAVYYSLKRIYALNQIYNSGLISKLLTQNSAKTIILFGSIIKGDWYKNSDIDIFIFGNISDFNKKLFEERLHKKIELHLFENKIEIKKVKTGLIKNVVNGYLVKGQIQDIIIY